jgi:C-methyltransferase
MTDAVPPYDLIDEVDLAGLKVAVVRAALELDVFTQVQRGRSDVTCLAAACAASERGMTVLVRALLSLGLLEDAGSGLRCSDTAAAYLVDGSRGYAAPVYLEWFRNRDRLVDAIRTGHGPGDHADEAAEEEWRAYAAPDLVRWRERAPLFAEVLAARGLTVAPGQRILDIGCGSGIVGFGLAAQHPDVELTCVDRAGVLDITRELAAEMGLAHRVRFVSGDLEDVALGAKAFDVALLTNVAQYLDDTRLVQVLGRIRTALRPEGCLYVAAVVVDDGTPGNTMNWASAVEMYLASSVDLRTATDVMERIRAAGFSHVEQRAPNGFLARV